MKKQTPRSQSKFNLAALALAFSTTIAAAHPGHSLQSESITHALTSPDHLLTLALFGGGLLLGATFVKHLAARRTMQLSGVATLIVAGLTFASQLLP